MESLEHNNAANGSKAYLCNACTLYCKEPAIRGGSFGMI